MPSANGSYVKVYLYLLRSFSSNNLSITISSIADHQRILKRCHPCLELLGEAKLLILEKSAKGDYINPYCKASNQNTRSDHSQILTEDTDSQLDEIAVSIHSEKAPVARQSIHKKR